MKLSTLFFAYRKAKATEETWERLYFAYSESHRYAHICEKNFKRARRRAKYIQEGLTKRLKKLES